jgi:hypothetical protein
MKFRLRSSGIAEHLKRMVNSDFMTYIFQLLLSVSIIDVTDTIN